MSCVKLISGQNSTCDSYVRKYYQQVVLVNKNDVANYLILNPLSNAGEINLRLECRYSIAFQLKEGKTGIRYTATEKGNIINGFFSRRMKEDIPQYKHSVQLPIFGVSEDVKCQLHRLDFSEYFAVLQTYDNKIEVFGFENGLEPDDYEFNIQNGGGGIILLTSTDSLEDMQPLIYRNSTNTEVEDFDNAFADVPDFDEGDFNDDFNDDFNNE